MSSWKGTILEPIVSMYGIFSYIYHKNQPNVGIYTIHGSYGEGTESSSMQPWWLSRAHLVGMLMVWPPQKPKNHAGCQGKMFPWPQLGPKRWRNAFFVGTVRRPLTFDVYFKGEKPWRINGRNLQITRLERKMIFQTSTIMVHVNLAGCNLTKKPIMEGIVIATSW